MRESGVMADDPQWNWPALDHAAAAALLSDHLPRADAHLAPLGHGEFCLAFRLGEQVVRVARHPAAAVALRREACVLGAIADALPLLVPRPTYHSPRACPPFTVHDEVTGELLTRDRWMGLPPAARQKAATDLATFLRALHAIPVAIGLECGLARLDGVELARRLREAAAVTLYPLLDRESQGRLDATLARWSSPPHRVRAPALLHCDIGPGHLLCDPATDSLTGVIDFGDIAVGDPGRDFIFIYEDYGPAILAEVLRRYAGGDPPSLRSEIRRWYLLEATSWTLEMCAAERVIDVEHGLAEIARELYALDL
ncbi:MAG: phosphotransferase family protein [Gemmatimonadaceae bacterium]